LAEDTLEYYVEHCYSYAGLRYDVFGIIGSAIRQEYPQVSSYANDSAMEGFRQWLFKVLYLNSDTESDGTIPYYCNDAMTAIGTLNPSDTFNLKGVASEAALEKYLIASGKCPFYVSQLEQNLRNLYQGWHIFWKDTVTDSLLTPWDTTLPTLQQIGFEILLGPKSSVMNFSALPSTVLGAISATPNPFDAEVEIRYTLNVPATLTVEVFDLLGNKVATLVPGTMTQNGDGMLKLAGLSPGSYYVRFSVPEGEVRTIKVIRQ
jgi:hypothetical protein